MRKRLFLCLLALLALLLFGACAGEGASVSYKTDHEHVYGASFDVEPAEGGMITEQVRYCKICHAEQVHPKQ